MATCLPPHSPRQTSASPPDARAILPRFSSPSESTAEVGSCCVTLHTFPKVVMNFVVRESAVGYALTEAMKGRLREEMTGGLDVPDRFCPQISFDPPVSVSGYPLTAPCYSAEKQLFAPTPWVSMCCWQTPGLQFLRGWDHEMQR